MTPEPACKICVARGPQAARVRPLLTASIFPRPHRDKCIVQPCPSYATAALGMCGKHYQRFRRGEQS